MSDYTQITKLAEYIMAEIPGEPSQSEGAGDTAIRLLKQYRAEIAKLNKQYSEEVEQFNAGFTAAEEGKEPTGAEVDYFLAHPDEPNHDEFMIGYAWAKYPVRKEPHVTSSQDDQAEHD